MLLCIIYCFLFVCLMVLNATFHNISAISVLLVGKTALDGVNHQPAESRRQTFSHNAVSGTPHHQ